MRDHHDAKAMAKTLREQLAARNVQFGHSECLEIVARQFGYKDWNILAALTDKPAPNPKLLPLPKGWGTTGQNTALFDIGILTNAGPTGENCIYIEGRTKRGRHDAYWITPMQTLSARQFRNRKVEFSATLRCVDLEDYAYLWFRVDNQRGQRIAYIGKLETDNADIFKGTQDWRTHAMVLPIPESAASISFGVTRYGLGGKLWIANMKFGISDKPITNDEFDLPPQPINLDLMTLA